MSGVLKTIGTIAGVAAAFLLAAPTGGASLLGLSAIGVGFATTALTITAFAATVGSSLLAGRPTAPAVSSATADRLNVSIDVNTPRKIVFGHTAMATDLRDQELTGNQDYLHRFLVNAAHAIDSTEEIWFDDKLAWSAAGGVSTEYAGYLTVTASTEGSAANAINVSVRMGSSRRFTGLAYVYLRYKLTGSSQKAESPFAQTVPTRVTIVGRGAKVYDPRLDSSVPGGSGPQRANDQTTWAWSDGAARNPALQLLWYLLGWRIRNPETGEGLLSVGKGIPPRRIDLASFITAANLCDEPVTLAAGGTEPRYRSDGIFSESDPTSTVIDQLKASMNAELDDVDGRFRITVLHNDLATPICDLTTDDVIGAFNWNQTAPLTDSFNIVRGTFVDPASLYQTPDYPQVSVDSPDGIDRIETIDFGTVQSVGQAQRLAKQRAARMLYSGTFSATFSHRAWKATKNDLIRFSFSPLGWENKLFRIVEATVQVDGRVPLILRVEHPDIYLWDNDERAAVQPAEPTTYDPALNPVLQDVLDPKYNDGTSINNLKPAEPGATHGMSPTEAMLLAQLEDDIAAAEAIAAQLQADATDLTNRILAAEGEIATTNSTLGTYGAAIDNNALAISNLEGDLASIDLTVRAGGYNLQPNGGCENGLVGYESGHALLQGDDEWGKYARVVPPAIAGPAGFIKAPPLPASSVRVGVQYTATADTACLAAGSTSIFVMVFFNSGGVEISRVQGEMRGPRSFAPDGSNRTANKATGIAPAGTTGIAAYFTYYDTNGANGVSVRQIKIERGDESSIFSSDAAVRQSFQAVASLDLDLASLETELLTLGAGVSTNALAISSLQSNVAALTTVVKSSSPNLLSNGGFENGLTGWNAGGALSWDTGSNVWGKLAYVGSLPQSPGGYFYLWRDFTEIAAGQQVTLSGEVALILSSGTGFGYLQIDWLDFPGTTILPGSGGGPSKSASFDFSQDGSLRTSLALTSIAPAGAGRCRVYAVLYAAPGAVVSWAAVRQMKLEFGPVPTPYSQEASVTQAFQSVNGALARAAVRLDVGGRMTGWETNNNGVIGDFRVHADFFSIEDPDGGRRTEYSSGNWRVFDEAGTLRLRMGIW